MTNLTSNIIFWIIVVLLAIVFLVLYLERRNSKKQRSEKPHDREINRIERRLPSVRSEEDSPPPYEDVVIDVEDETYDRAPEFSLDYDPTYRLGDLRGIKCIGEHLTYHALRNIIKSEDIRRGYRPSFLKNPATGRALELDCYDETTSLAVEYNGLQHYQFPNSFHRTQQEFLDQVNRDNIKRELCDRQGVYLIPVPCTVDNVERNSKGDYYSVRRTYEERYVRIYDYLYLHIREYLSIRNNV